MNVLGVDYGRTYKGLALGSTETKLAMPFKTLARQTNEIFLKELQEIISAYAIQLIIVGLPATWPEDRSRPGMREEVEEFVKKISQTLHLPVEAIDERFTTDGAQKLKHEYPSGNEHALAAMLILQTYLDRLK